MKKPKAPELKMPDLKVPGFATDLYYDLRDRRLLPLVALVLVAIVAVPFLLSDSPEESGPPRVMPPTAGASSVNTSQLTVVPATPGLRDYRKRLRGRSPKDPFQAKTTTPDLSSAKLGSKENNGFEASEVTTSTTSTSTSTTDTTESTETTETTKTTGGDDAVVTTETETTTESTEEPGSQEGEDETKQDSAEPTLYSFAIDVRIKKTTTTADGGTESGDPLTRAKVLAPSALPGEKAQVVTYMGVTQKTRNPMFLVSDEVTAVFGEAKCLAGVRTCQLLEVEQGMPTTFVFGPQGARYKITVLKVQPVAAGNS
jgi:hypothetical protein